MALKIVRPLLATALLVVAAKLLYDFVVLQQMMDFAMVWESSRLLVAGENPYILAGHKIGLDRPMAGNWYPPILFSLVLPFVFVSFNCAKFLWITVSFVGHIASYFLLTKWEDCSIEMRIFPLLVLLTCSLHVTPSFMGSASVKPRSSLFCHLVIFSMRRLLQGGPQPLHFVVA